MPIPIPRRKDIILFKLVATAVILFLVSLPLDLYLGVRAFASPEGFWQEFALGAVAIWVLGGSQIAFLILGMVILFCIWTPD
ncbi:TPA: hypothetical protein DEP34_01675 [Candidatus Uhrbacteria bacterium]|uniref:Uncharacterized protein n=2 Tax=Candidatus Uhriibacteriota TaxID=1752732 RepID=A0A0G1Q5M1_9BACT|nr:MAG: hypothetical protein UX45_C0031G0009 [Candidatus Uhrbacteria bacterium GW2011_GWF2_46_218]KKU40269.1 MAG: hypothetical protein UX57_C0021G0001 [Candidatus Uhrbacteria bacterium GW2011_GWE2_46_68]HBK34316.1 hypothetical protein [Candidatus Uhrbacteria bacterium]HCB19078.1 hypothetical protein [Candidatus Uhrbacteria bacterium]